MSNKPLFPHNPETFRRLRQYMAFQNFKKFWLEMWGANPFTKEELPYLSPEILRQFCLCDVSIFFQIYYEMNPIQPLSEMCVEAVKRQVSR